MEVLFEQENIQFAIEKNFEMKYLSPIQSYIKWKLDNNQWDDYNEFLHAGHLVERLKKTPNVWFDTHVLWKDDLQIGVVLVVGGEIQKLESKYKIKNESHSLLLKYFHIADKGQGHGSLWLKSVIIPFYREKNFERIYVNSSHKVSFPFYTHIGKPIAEYRQESDNHLNLREGCCFLIEI